MNYPEMQADILEMFAEAQARAETTSRIDVAYANVANPDSTGNPVDQKLGFNRHSHTKRKPFRTPKANGRPPKPIRDDEGTWYPSIKAAAIHLGIPHPMIVNVLKGRKKTTYGRSFTYAEAR